PESPPPKKEDSTPPPKTEPPQTDNPPPAPKDDAPPPYTPPTTTSATIPSTFGANQLIGSSTISSLVSQPKPISTFMSRYPLLSILMPTLFLPVGFLLIHDHVLQDNVAHSLKPYFLKRSHANNHETTDTQGQTRTFHFFLFVALKRRGLSWHNSDSLNCPVFLFLFCDEPAGCRIRKLQETCVSFMFDLLVLSLTILPEEIFFTELFLDIAVCYHSFWADPLFPFDAILLSPSFCSTCSRDFSAQGSIPIPFFFSRFAWPCYYHCPRSFGFWSRCADQNSYTFWDDYLGNSYPKYGNCCGLGEYSPASSLLPYVKRENMMLGNPVLHTQIVSKQSPFIEMRPLLNVMKPTYVVYVFYDLCANVPSLRIFSSSKKEKKKGKNLLPIYIPAWMLALRACSPSISETEATFVFEFYHLGLQALLLLLPIHQTNCLQFTANQVQMILKPAELVLLSFYVLFLMVALSFACMAFWRLNIHYFSPDLDQAYADAFTELPGNRNYELLEAWESKNFEDHQLVEDLIMCSASSLILAHS
ncbi:hypothetical protein VP01_3921g1, partial [Puccinia sorghi]